ncbi:MAG TPA: glycoside hydrolase family 36 N-terminal domain-containing protein, partial [Bacillota bacterium]|nr:glycoside hydrolase family 36 N-terminal domain-containing protein [Bacillota bacterium]
MGIQYFPEVQTFHLQGKQFSYLIKIFQGKTLLNLYYGKKIRSKELDHLIPSRDRAFGLNPDPENRNLPFDCLPMEYPCYGHFDYRHPALHLQYENGATVTDLIYKSHRIYPGKEPLEGLPAAYIEETDEAETLEIILEDPLTSVELRLTYTVYNNRDILCRSARLNNGGSEQINVKSVQSMSVDLLDSRYEMLQLSGAWARERMPVRRPLVPGMQSVGSRRGASSHQHNPFIALLRPETTESFGEVFGFSLVYSGNFLAEVEVSEQGMTRVTMGIDPFNFSWLLKPGESFQSPEVIMAYSPDGLGGLSRTYHDLFRERLCRGIWRDRERPILVNNW